MTIAVAAGVAVWAAVCVPAARAALHVRCVAERVSSRCAHGRALDSPLAVSIAPGGRYAYVSGDALISLRRTPSTGAVRQLAGIDGCATGSAAAAVTQHCRRVPGLGSLGAIATTPDGRFVYVASSSPTRLRVFRRNTHTGVLKPVAGAAGCVAPRSVAGCRRARAIGSPGSFAISRDGRFLYVTSVEDSAVAVFSRNRATGGLRQLPGTDGCVAQIDQPIASCATGRALSFAQAVALSPDGLQAYVVGGTSTDLEATGDGLVAVFSRDPRTGALHQLPGTAGCVQPAGGGSPANAPCTSAAKGLSSTALYGVAVSRDGRSVYASGWSADRGAGFAYGDVVTFSRSAADGSLGQPADPAACIGLVPSCVHADVGGLGGVTVAPDLRSVYAAGGGRVAAFDRDRVSGLLSVRRIVHDPVLLSDVGAPALTPDGRDLFVPSSTVGGTSPGGSALGFDVAVYRGA